MIRNAFHGFKNVVMFIHSGMSGLMHIWTHEVDWHLIRSLSDAILMEWVPVWPCAILAFDSMVTC